jgi:predicted dehydrogenase
VTRVNGIIRNFAGTPDVEDLSVAMLEFESGATATHVSVWHNILHRGSSRRITITSENAQFGWDDDDWAASIRVDAQRDGARTRISSNDVVARHIDIAGITDDRLRAAMTPQYAGQDYMLEGFHFLKAVSEDRPAFPDFDVAVYAHTVVDAIYQSAREGRPIDIEAQDRPAT